MIAVLRRQWWLLLILALLAGTAAGLIALAGAPNERGSADACPQGQQLVRGEAESRKQKAEEKDRGEGGDYESHFVGRCAPVSHPESSADLTKFNEYAST